jgi:protein-L-isoaspartate(D-aspartate) O-methyltransferase
LRRKYRSQELRSTRVVFSAEMLDLARARERMVDVQIARRGVRDARVLEAMRRVPREAFVEPGYAEFAYEDGALPIAEGQTISQPYIVTLMIEAAEVRPGDSVLEVGVGSGYAAAVTSQIADRICGIERQPALVEAARRRFRELGYDNVELRLGDGTRGWPEAAPFEAILVSAGGPAVPNALKEQLAIGAASSFPSAIRSIKICLRSPARARPSTMKTTWAPSGSCRSLASRAGRRTAIARPATTYPGHPAVRRWRK